MVEDKSIEVVSDQNLDKLQDLASLTIHYAKSARSKNTNRAYAADWQDFEYWCKTKNVACLPAHPASVAAYIADRAANSWQDKEGIARDPLKVSSLARRLSAISQAHLLSGIPFDRKHRAISETWKGIKNTHGVAQSQKRPILIEDLREMVKHCDPEGFGKKYLTKARDKALLVLGFAGAFRRSELVSIDKEHLKLVREGYIVRLNRSKTDQEGAGREVAIPYGSNPLTCPVRALMDWLSFSNIEAGPIFRPINRHGHVLLHRLSSKAVALIIKRNVHLKGKEGFFAGHSLRAGFVTTAAEKGVAEHAIMKQTGHKRSDTLKKYIRSAEIWKENPATKVGL